MIKQFFEIQCARVKSRVAVPAGLALIRLNSSIKRLVPPRRVESLTLAPARYESIPLRTLSPQSGLSG